MRPPARPGISRSPAPVAGLDEPGAATRARPLLAARETWTAVTVLWGAAGLLTGALEYALQPVDPAGAATLAFAIARLVEAIAWWMTTLLAIALSDAFTFRSPRYEVILLHAVLGVGVAVLRGIAVQALSALTVPGWRVGGLERVVHETYPTTFLLYLATAGVAHGVIHSREHRARELEARSSELIAARTAGLATQARLQVLKMEMQPHFLFNTLNSISALMHRNVERANEMLVLLADMLKSSLANSRDREVPLRAELETLEAYVRIQQIRLGDRLRVDWSVDPETLDASVPHLILQPLVENATEHGVSRHASGGTVAISARRVGDRLELAVCDDGGGAAESHPGFGLGIAYIRVRLEQHYGDAQRFDLAPSPDGGMLATVSLPFTVVADGSGKKAEPAMKMEAGRATGSVPHTEPG